MQATGSFFFCFFFRFCFCFLPWTPLCSTVACVQVLSCTLWRPSSRSINPTAHPSKKVKGRIQRDSRVDTSLKGMLLSHASARKVGWGCSCGRYVNHICHLRFKRTRGDFFFVAEDFFNLRGGRGEDGEGGVQPTQSVSAAVSQSCGVVWCFVLLVVVRAVRVVNAKGTDTDDVCAGCWNANSRGLLPCCRRESEWDKKNSQSKAS